MKNLIVKTIEGNIKCIIKKSEIVSYHCDIRDKGYFRRLWVNLRTGLQYDLLFTKDTIQGAIKTIDKVNVIKETAGWEDFIKYEENILKKEENTII